MEVQVEAVEAERVNPVHSAQAEAVGVAVRTVSGLKLQELEAEAEAVHRSPAVPAES